MKMSAFHYFKIALSITGIVDTWIVEVSPCGSMCVIQFARVDMVSTSAMTLAAMVRTFPCN